MIQYLEVTFEELPVSKIFTFENVDYIFEFYYNGIGDFITIQIVNEDEVIFSTKLSYGNNLLERNGFGIPFALIPLKESDLLNDKFSSLKVNKENFGKDVFIFFDDNK